MFTLELPLRMFSEHFCTLILHLKEPTVLQGRCYHFGMVLPIEISSSRELPPVAFSSSQVCSVGLAILQGLPQSSVKC